MYDVGVYGRSKLMERYGRQIIIDEIGLEGQQKLKEAKVLVIGAGGLGSPVIMYLAAAGIGTIGIVDSDVINESNLNRQIIHEAKNLGMNKALSAKETVKSLNDSVEVITYPVLLDKENAAEIIRKYDFIVDCVDNFEGKFLINDVCVAEHKAFCHAGVIRFQGQVLTYVPGKGPCYRCIFEEVPKKGTVPESFEVGIIGAIAGTIGSIQALEAIKYILGIGELLTGKMYILDGLNMRGRLVKFPNPSKACKACGNNIL